jgi:predicted dehydrogenase
MPNLRAAVIGLGLGRQRAMGYLQNVHVDLCAVCDVDTDRVLAFKREHPEVRGYVDYEEMLHAEKPEIVNVSTPDWMHLEHSRIALERGCHVLVEKPMVCTLREAETMIRAVEENGRTLMVGQNYRRSPMAIVAQQLLAHDRLGTVFYAAAETFQNKRRQFERATWYASAEHPRAALLGTGIHAVDLLRWLLGEVEEAIAYANHLAYRDFPADDFTMALYRFPNDVVGRAGVAYGAVLPRGEGGLTLQVFGSEGTLHNDRFYAGPAGEGAWEQADLPPMKNAFWREVDHLIECLMRGEAPEVDVYEGARNVAACLAGVEAAATGRPVRPHRF